ncbi:MAG: lipocalin family protein [Campylobacterota bacterium]
MMRISLLITFTLMMLFFAACDRPTKTPLTTVPAADLERYSGAWNELARYENYTEAGCVGATANYQRINDRLSVINSCYDGSGRLKAQDKGTMKVVEGSNNSKFKIDFPWRLQGDYWVLMLAEDYRYSVVSTPDREYLWILSRKTVLSPEDRETILSTLTELGFDTEKLYWTGFKAMCNVESELKR